MTTEQDPEIQWTTFQESKFCADYITFSNGQKLDKHNMVIEMQYPDGERKTYLFHLKCKTEGSSMYDSDAGEERHWSTTTCFGNIYDELHGHPIKLSLPALSTLNNSIYKDKGRDNKLLVRILNRGANHSYPYFMPESWTKEMQYEYKNKSLDQYLICDGKMASLPICEGPPPDDREPSSNESPKSDKYQCPNILCSKQVKIEDLVISPIYREISKVIFNRFFASQRIEKMATIDFKLCPFCEAGRFWIGGFDEPLSD